MGDLSQLREIEMFKTQYDINKILYHVSGRNNHFVKIVISVGYQQRAENHNKPLCKLSCSLLISEIG